MKKSTPYRQNSQASLALETKINTYREKYNKSQQKFTSKYAWKSPLNKKQSKSKITQHQGLNRASSADIIINAKRSTKMLAERLSGSGLSNPERQLNPLQIKKSIVLSGLNGQAKEMTGYAIQNKQLLTRRANLENSIQKLKQKIAHQNKSLHQTKIDCGVLTNKIEMTNQRFEQKQELNLQLQQHIAKTANQISVLMRQVHQKSEQSRYNKELIQKTTTENENLEVQTSNTRVMQLKEDQQRLTTKQSLNLWLKVMQNSAIRHTQLQDEKKNLQSTISKAFQQNKILNSSSVSVDSRLFINSRRTVQ